MVSDTLSHRERLLRVLRRQPVDRLPDYEFGAWKQTIPRWKQEGLVARGEDHVNYSDDTISLTFETDEAEFGPQPKVNVKLLPAFEEHVLEEKGTHQIFMDAEGTLMERLNPDLGASIPHYIRHAIVTRADWEKIRAERLDPNHPDRIPFHIEAMGQYVADADYPVILPGISLYGWIRDWMGVENLSYALGDDPAWVEAMMEHLTQLALSVYARLAGKIKVDLCWWWEDMCYRSGPLIAPRTFAKLMVPRYQRITDFLRHELGCEYNILDCDGNIHQLVPLWLDGGINIMFPLEARHTDAVRLRREHDDRLLLRGAFDKFALIAGPEAIDREFERLRPLKEAGAFIPHTDHRVPPDVPLAHYIYYRQRKCEFIGKAWHMPKTVRYPLQWVNSAA